MTNAEKTERRTTAYALLCRLFSNRKAGHNRTRVTSTAKLPEKVNIAAYFSRQRSRGTTCNNSTRPRFRNCGSARSQHVFSSRRFAVDRESSGDRLTASSSVARCTSSCDRSYVHDRTRLVRHLRREAWASGRGRRSQGGAPRGAGVARAPVALNATASRSGDRSCALGARLRKVGTSQDRVLARARSGKPDIPCNREHTADGAASVAIRQG